MTRLADTVERVEEGVVAVDVGGTTLKALALTGHGEVVAESVVATPSGGDGVRSALRDLVAVMVGELETHGATPRRIGIATPGVVDPEQGVVAYASNLGWRDLPLAADLRAEFGVAVHVEHDAKAGALAEHAARTDGTGADLAFVPIGTGVSAAYFAGDDLLRGTTGAIGEFGHVRAVPGGDLCACGARGCVEAYTSATNLVVRYRRAGGRADDAADVVARIGRDPIAARVWREALDALAVGLGGLVMLLDPSRIVIGGGLSLAGPTLLDPLRERLDAEVPWRAMPPVSASGFGARSVLVGAALLGDDRPAADRWELVQTLAAALRHGGPAVVR